MVVLHSRELRVGRESQSRSPAWPTDWTQGSGLLQAIPVETLILCSTF